MLSLIYVLILLGEYFIALQIAAVLLFNLALAPVSVRTIHTTAALPTTYIYIRA